MDALRKFGEEEEARVALSYALSNSYASLMLVHEPMLLMDVT